MTTDEFVSPDSPQLDLNVDELRKHAQRAINEGRFPEAIQSLEMITTIVPDHSAAWNDLGVAFLLNGQAEQSLEAIEHVCTFKRANQNLWRSLLTRVRKGRNTLVPRLRSMCRRRFALLRSIATCARSTGARLPRTTHVSVVGLRKTERRSLISTPLRKAVRKTITKIITSRSSLRKLRSLRKC